MHRAYGIYTAYRARTGAAAMAADVQVSSTTEDPYMKDGIVMREMKVESRV